MTWLPSIALAAAIPFVGYGLVLALTGWLERQPLSRPGPRANPPGGIAPRVVGLALLVTAALLVGATLPGTSQRWLACGVGLVAMVSAWSMHGSPGHSRGFKYALFLGGGALFGTTFGSDRALAELLGLDWTLRVIAPSFLVIAGSTLWIVAILQPDVPPRGPWAQGMVRRWYWRVTSIQGPDPVSFLRYLLLMVGQLGPGFLLVRYAVRAKLLDEPFLYLRPYAPRSGPRVFTDVIGPGLHRRGPFVGLVNADHRTRELAAGVPRLWSADFSTVGDEDWATWVVSTIARSRAVILDTTGVPGDGGSDWVVEQCRAMVHPERMLVVTQTGDSPLGPEYAHLFVDLDRPDAARAGVAAFAGYVNGLFGIDDPRRGRWIPRRRPATGWMVAGLVATWFGAQNLPSILAYTAPESQPSRDIELTRFELVQLRALARMQGIEGSYRACIRFAHPEGPPDAWGTPIELTCASGGQLEVRSAGPDREFGTGDDLMEPRP